MLSADDNQSQQQSNKERKNTNSFNAGNKTPGVGSNSEAGVEEVDLKEWNFDYDQDSSSMESVEED